MNDDTFEYLLEKGCRSKIRFHREAAEEAIDRLSAQGEMMYWYECGFCFGYHLTSTQPKDSNALREDILLAVKERLNNYYTYQRVPAKLRDIVKRNIDRDYVRKIS